MFEEIIGHDKQIDILKTAIKKDNISHAYLFTGNRGIGKNTVALEFAKYILNTNNLKSSPDFKYICKNEDKKDIVVEQIRKEIIDDVYIAPAASKRKVYIIDDAEKLNIAAQNALLKTLEEPPKYVVIILVASNINNFLTTILSRVNQITFDSIPKEKFENYLLNSLNCNLNDNIVNFLDGSLGQAIYLIRNEKINKLELIDKLYDFLEKKDTINALINATNIDFTDNICFEYLEYKLYNNGKYFWVKFVEKAIIRLKNNGNYDIVIDNMILKIIDNI